MSKKNSVDNLLNKYIKYDLRGNGNNMMNVVRVVAKG